MKHAAHNTFYVTSCTFSCLTNNANGGAISSTSEKIDFVIVATTFNSC